MRALIRSAAVMAGLVSAAAASAATVSFNDSFTPAPSPLWSNSSGNWTSAGGNYYAQAAKNTPTTFTGLPFDLSNFTLNVTINNLTDGGIWLRTDGAKLVNGSPQNGVLLVTGGGGYGQGVRGGTAGTAAYFHVVQNGIYSGQLAEVDNVFTPGTAYNLTVTAGGNSYAVFVNGSSTPLTTLTDATYSHGEVGLYDDQPNTAAGGTGLPQTFSAFSVNGTTVPEPAAASIVLVPLLCGRRARRGRGRSIDDAV